MAPNKDVGTIDIIFEPFDNFETGVFCSNKDEPSTPPLIIPVSWPKNDNINNEQLNPRTQTWTEYMKSIIVNRLYSGMIYILCIAFCACLCLFGIRGLSGPREIDPGVRDFITSTIVLWLLMTICFVIACLRGVRRHNMSTGSACLIFFCFFYCHFLYIIWIDLNR